MLAILLAAMLFVAIFCAAAVVWGALAYFIFNALLPIAFSSVAWPHLNFWPQAFVVGVIITLLRTTFSGSTESK